MNTKEQAGEIDPRWAAQFDKLASSIASAITGQARVKEHPEILPGPTDTPEQFVKFEGMVGTDHFRKLPDGKSDKKKALRVLSCHPQFKANSAGGHGGFRSRFFIEEWTYLPETTPQPHRVQNKQERPRKIHAQFYQDAADFVACTIPCRQQIEPEAED